MFKFNLNTYFRFSAVYIPLLQNINITYQTKQANQIITYIIDYSINEDYPQMSNSITVHVIQTTISKINNFVRIIPVIK